MYTQVTYMYIFKKKANSAAHSDVMQNGRLTADSLILKFPFSSFIKLGSRHAFVFAQDTFVSHAFHPNSSSREIIKRGAAFEALCLEFREL